MSETPSQPPLTTTTETLPPYWCYHCDKRVSIETVANLPDLICGDCKNGFVESIPTPSRSRSPSSSSDDPNFGSQFLQVLRLIAQSSRDDDASPPPPPSRSPENDFLRIELGGWDHDDEDNEDDEFHNDGGDHEGVAEELEDRLGIEDPHGEDEDMRRRRRDLLRHRIRDLATRTRSMQNRILDWAEILMGLEDNSIEFRLQAPELDRYVGNPEDYVDAAEYEALLQTLAENDGNGRRGAPPASKSSVEALPTVKIAVGSEVVACAVCKDMLGVVLALFLVGFFGMFKFGFNPDTPFPQKPCSTTLQKFSISNHHSFSKLGFGSVLLQKERKTSLKNDHNDEFLQHGSEFLVSHVQLQAKGSSEFWKKPNGLGYKPCLSFSNDYRRQSERVLKDRRKYLMVVVSGGMNQQRNQIVDAVVIARILGAALVVPVLQVNVIWGDESEFGDIFDLEHFKRVLANDVRVVSALPSTHIMTRAVEGRPPLHATPSWIRARYLRRLNREGVLLLRGLDSRLSKDLPSDLQKLRCKVAFNALRFAEPIEELGNKIADRMKSKGPYLALHLRMEKDVWVRTGCLPGLTPEYDEVINNERIQRPELLTARSNMTYHQRKMAGLCPLNVMEVMRLLKALGAPKDARIYWAGGKPLGGKEALLPLIQEFPNFYNKEDLALPGELQPFVRKASLMAAIDYIVSEKSDVFMPSHGGNMGRAIQGHRAFTGHKKYITPNKRHMLPYFLNSSLSDEEFNRIIKELHQDSLGQPELRTNKNGRDVTKYPVPECMCNDSHAQS